MILLKGFLLLSVCYSIVLAKSKKLPTENRMVRKGGLSKFEKKKMDISKVYVHPDMRDQIKFKNSAELVKYTVCKGIAYEMKDNVTSTVYEYTICPVSKTSEKITVNSAQDYCCYNVTLVCCNLEAYKEYIAEYDAMVKSKLWKAGILFVLVIGIIIVVCTLKKYLGRWQRPFQGNRAGFHPVGGAGVMTQPVTNTTVVVAAPQPGMMPQQYYPNQMVQHQQQPPPPQYPAAAGMPQVTTNTTMNTMVASPMGGGMMVSPDNTGTITDGNPALPMAPIPQAPPGSYPTNYPSKPPAYQ